MHFDQRGYSKFCIPYWVNVCFFYFLDPLWIRRLFDSCIVPYPIKKLNDNKTKTKKETETQNRRQNKKKRRKETT